MNIGKEIAAIRREQNLTQEEFGQRFHVTRQTVSNWENEKSYPDLQILVQISDEFDISLDKLLKGDLQMVKTMDRERILGNIKREKSVIDFFTGAGTGIMASRLLTPDSVKETVVILIGIAMVGVGWYLKARYDRRIMEYFETADRE